MNAAVIPESIAQLQRYSRGARHSTDPRSRVNTLSFQAEFIFNLVLPHFRCSGEPRDIGSNRARKSSKPARPYIWRLSVFSRLM
jgi:hypothetical protein